MLSHLGPAGVAFWWGVGEKAMESGGHCSAMDIRLILEPQTQPLKQLCSGKTPFVSVGSMVPARGQTGPLIPG